MNRPDYPDCSASEALTRFAPTAGSLLRRTIASDFSMPLYVNLARRAAADAIGLAPLPDAPVVAELGLTAKGAETREITASDQQALHAFVQQLSVDVTQVSDATRAALPSILGRALQPFVQAVWVADIGTRLIAALDALFGIALSDWLDPPAAPLAPADVRQSLSRSTSFSESIRC